MTISTRLRARVEIEFDCGSEYGGRQTFEDVMADATRAAQNKCHKLVSSKDHGIIAAEIKEIVSFTITRPLP